jgi:hypothetical protein
MATFPYFGLSNALQDVPEVYETREYTDRLLRIGGLDTKVGWLGKTVNVLYTIIWITVAVACLLVPLGLGLGYRYYGFDVSNHPMGLLIIQFVLVPAGLLVVFGTFNFWVQTLGFYRRLSRWRKNLAQREITQHLALTPAGGWFVAAAVGRSWVTYLRNHLLPLVVIVICGGVGSGILQLFSDSQSMNLPEVSLIGVLSFLYYLSAMVLFSLIALSTIGNKTFTNWALALLFILSGTTFQSKGIAQTLANSANSGDWGGILLDLIAAHGTKFAFHIWCWALVIAHIRDAGPRYSAKILKDYRSSNPMG